jgi:hypothetical protein
MKYGSGQSERVFELDRKCAHPLPINDRETCEWGDETDSGFAGSLSLFILSPNGKSKR